MLTPYEVIVLLICLVWSGYWVYCQRRPGESACDTILRVARDIAGGPPTAHP